MTSFDQVLLIITLVPNREKFPCRNDWTMKEAWEGRGPAEHKCDLARGWSWNTSFRRHQGPHLN